MEAVLRLTVQILRRLPHLARHGCNVGNTVGLRVLELLLQNIGKLLPLLRRGNKVSIAVNEIVQNLLVSGLLVQEEPLIPSPSVALPLGAALQMRRVRGPVVQSLHALVVQPGNVVRFPGGVVCRLGRVGVSRAQAEGFGVVVGGVLLSSFLHRGLRRFVVGLQRSRALRDALRRVVRAKDVGVVGIELLPFPLNRLVVASPQKTGDFSNLLHNEQISVILPEGFLVG